MGLLGKATLLFLLINCAFHQSYGQYGSDVEKQMQQLSNMMNSQSNFNSRLRPSRGNLNAETEALYNQFQLIMTQLLLAFNMRCQKAGHSEVFQSLESKITEATDCVTNKVNIDTIDTEFAEAERVGDLQSFFQKYCKAWPNVHGCLNPLVSSIEKCLDSDENRAIDKSFDIIDDANTFFCENNAQRIIQLVQDQGFECFDSAQGGVQACTAEMSQRIAQRGSNKIMMTYDKQDCSELHSWRKCVVGKLNECPTKSASQIGGEFLERVIQKACNSASTLSWFSFANIALLLASYLYSKLF